MPSKHSKRLLEICKIAIQQGLLFNTPPKNTKKFNGGTKKEVARRVKQQPDNSGQYLCVNCNIKINEDEIAQWVDAGESEQTFYNPKINKDYADKVINTLNDAKELIETFVAEYKRLPPIKDGLDWEETIKSKEPYVRLIEDFNQTSKAITRTHFAGEEVYSPLSFLKNMRFPVAVSLHDLTYYADGYLKKINNYIEFFKQNGLEVVDYKTIIMYPLCSDCFDGLAITCNWCGETGLNNFINPDKEDNFVKIDKNPDRYLCEVCYGSSTKCRECNDVIHSDESLIDDDYCESCYEKIERGRHYNNLPIQNIINERADTDEAFFPVDTSQISKTILPKVLLPLKNRSFSLEAITRQADKANLNPELKLFLLQTAKSGQFVTMQDVIDKLQRQLESEKQLKIKYPGIKRFNKIPVDINVEDKDGNDRDMPSFSITIKPSRDFISYAETLFPGIATKALKELTNGGYHHGAIAYARVGYDENSKAFVINNLQTDADLQKIKNNELLRSIVFDKLEDQKMFEAAIRWWLKQFENWPAQLIDIIKQIGERMKKKVYLTSFDMQQRKWQNIPERNKDVYDTIPAQMGFKQEEVNINTESLGKDKYLMRRIARIKRIRQIKKM